MRRRVIAWALIIFFALILYIFDNETVTLALLVSAVVALPVSYLLLRFTGKHLEVAVSEAVTGSDRSSFIIRMSNKGVMPIAAAEIEVKCTNLRTGESDMFDISRSLGPHKNKDVSVDVTPTNAGRYELVVTSAEVTDPLGIWVREGKCSGAGYITCLPDMFEMQLMSAGSSAMPESDRQSIKSKGSVAGDTIGIREYIAGDPVRNIHWKLSEKMDKILVRELGASVTDRLLVIMDTTADIAQDPAALNAVASVFTSLIHALTLSDMIFSISWTDPVTGEAVIRRIESQEEAASAADEYLAVPAFVPSAFRRISRDIIESRFAHVIIVGSKIPEDIENITNGCQVTVLMYGTRESFSDKNLTVIGFDAGSYQTDASGIEV